MTAQQLKNSILQMAVQGKLVPQDPNDEPASVLLDRIRAEKEQLIKEKKIKKEKNPSIIFRGADNLPYEKVGKNEPVCIADDVPFEIPDSWEWVRLGTVFNIEMGQSPAGNTVSSNKDGIEFHQGKVHFGEIFLQESGQYTSDPKKYAEQNSVLLCVRAPVGKVNITRRKICIGRGLCAILPFADMPLMFLYYLLEAYENIFVKQATGTTFIAITAETVKNQLIPLPPLEEQKRIADKISELYVPLKKYGDVESETRMLNSKFPEQLKKSILQWAVQGKLVPQDPTDEPAEALLERIREEKQRLIREGKIKKDKHESVIFRRDNSHYEKLDGTERCIDNELPFEIPESWCWVRFGTALINRDAERIPLSVAQREKLQKKYDYYGASGVIDKVDQYLFDKPLLLIGEDGANLLLRSKPIAFIASGQYWVNNHAHVIDSVGGVDLRYIALFINAINLAPYVTGTAQPKMNQEKLNSILVPLPPVAEQQRIVTAFEEIVAIIR